ncbi:unnamed protein product, partial [Polarella glacialis]
ASQLRNSLGATAIEEAAVAEATWAVRFVLRRTDLCNLRSKASEHAKDGRSMGRSVISKSDRSVPAGILGGLANVIIFALGRRIKRNAGSSYIFLFEKILGCEVWAYSVSMALQAIIYPSCMFVAWMSWSVDSFQPQMGRASAFAVRLFLYCLFGYLARDLPLCDDKQMQAHHVSCMLGVLVALRSEEGGIAAALGIFYLECGSFLYNFWIIDSTMRDVTWLSWPRGSGRSGETLVHLLFKVGFTATNIIGAQMLAIAVAANADHTGTAAFYALFGLPLLFMRQRECLRLEKPGSAMQSAKQPPSKQLD